MKIKLLLLFKDVLMYSFYGLSIQLFLCTLVLATDVSMAQENVSVKDSYASFNFDSRSLESIFEQIEKNTNYTFTYDRRELDKSIKLTQKYDNASVYEILMDLSKKAQLSFKQLNNNIIVSKRTRDNGNIGFVRILEDVDISGKVTDENGQGLPGASIVQVGTAIGTTSDLDGNYKLSVSEGATLKISFVGYLSQEVQVGSQSVIDIKMAVDAAQLDEIVIVGYGTQKVTNLTGAVTVITDEALENRAVNNASNLLAGLGSGITVVSTGGQPGKDGSTISIRGNTTFGGSNEPLVIIDGIEGTLDIIDPNDIESISVLKDASASAIYGVRGGNGVIVVKTKRGREGNVAVRFNSSIGFQNFIETPEFANAYEYATIWNQALENDGLSPEFNASQLQAFQSGTNSSTNWLDALITGSGVTHRYHLSASGGSDNFSYSTSLGYLDTEGMLPNTNFKRYNLRTNFDQSIGKRLNVAYNLALSRGDVVEPSGGAEVNLFNAFRTPSTSPVRNSDGNYVGYRGERNAVAQARDGGNESTITDDLIATINASYEIIGGLTFTNILSATQRYRVFNEWDKFVQLYSEDGLENGQFPNKILVQNYNRTDINIQSLLKYEKSLKAHSIKAMIGHGSIKSDAKLVAASRTGLPVANTTDELALGDAASQTNNSDVMSNRLESYFGRLNYNFDEKYLVEVSFRHDATSRFAPGNRKEFFPSFSLGWNIANEDFLNASFIDNLKIRGSWGQLGNQEIANSAYAPTFISGGRVENGGVVGSSSIAAPYNQDLTWETITKTNIGIDAAIMDYKFKLTADYFMEERSDILALDLLPGVYGDEAPFVNFAGSEAAGFEFNLNHNSTIGNDLKLEANINLTYFTKAPTVTDLTPTAEAPGRSNGDPISNIYGYTAMGLFQSQSEIDDAADQTSLGTTSVPGDIRYADINGRDANGELTGMPDGVIDTDDRYSLGSYTPEVFYGLSLNAGFKGFDMSMLFQGTGKVKNTLIAGAIHPSAENALKIHLDSWTPTNTDASYPTLHAVNTSGNEISYTGVNSYFTYNASYVRLKNLQIGYSLPESVIDKIGLTKLRVYLSAENILTFKNADFPDGIDPEAISIGFEQDRQDPGVNQTPVSPFNSGNAYPMVKTITMGLNVAF
ncbi:MAG: SusC/RagA family TonB-linked outer membrane protein [Cyclobacteriaceae bacterium]